MTQQQLEKYLRGAATQLREEITNSTFFHCHSLSAFSLRRKKKARIWQIQSLVFWIEEELNSFPAKKFNQSDILNSETGMIKGVFHIPIRNIKLSNP